MNIHDYIYIYVYWLRGERVCKSTILKLARVFPCNEHTGNSRALLHTVSVAAMSNKTFHNWRQLPRFLLRIILTNCGPYARSRTSGFKLRFKALRKTHWPWRARFPSCLSENIFENWREPPPVSGKHLKTCGPWARSGLLWRKTKGLKTRKKVRAHIVRLRKSVGVFFFFINWREGPFVCAGKMHSFRHGDVWTRFQKWGERSVAFEKKKHCKTCGPWANHGMRVFWWCGFMDYQINLQSGFGTLTTQNGIKKAKQVGIDPPADDMSLFSLIYTGILYDALQSWGSEKCAANCVEKCSKLDRSRNLRVLKMRRGGLLKMIE